MKRGCIAASPIIVPIASWYARFAPSRRTYGTAGLE
jgi:hypothetical protein